MSGRAVIYIIVMIYIYHTFIKEPCLITVVTKVRHMAISFIKCYEKNALYFGSLYVIEEFFACCHRSEKEKEEATMELEAQTVKR